MSYDWHGTNQALEGTREYYKEIDRRFFGASPLFKGDRPFARLIPFARLTGKKVLEIGCGQGSHTQLFAEAGCDVTSIDQRAVELTKRRLELNDLTASVHEMDAEKMEFAAGGFDFVWSWGVIHHSAHTDQIVREVARVLRPGGEFRFMVYHRRAFDTYMKILRGLLTAKPLKGMSMDDILSYYTDGYVARFYTRQSITELVAGSGLETSRIAVLGQTSELLPLPGKGAIGRLKYSLLARFPDSISESALRTIGSFLFVVARKPS
jgi:SAM-dependent methyltransferase